MPRRADFTSGHVPHCEQMKTMIMSKSHGLDEPMPVKLLDPRAHCQPRTDEQVSTQSRRPSCPLTRGSHIIHHMHCGFLPHVCQHSSHVGQRLQKVVRRLGRPHEGQPAHEVRSWKQHGLMDPQTQTPLNFHLQPFYPPFE